MLVKTCTKCKEEKSLEAFGFDSRHRDGRQSHCRECDLAAKKVWRLANLEQVRLRDRARAGHATAKAAKAEYDRLYRKTPKRRLSERQVRLKTFWPHLTHAQAEQEWDRLLLEQGGVCAICKGKQLVYPTKKKSLCIDHCHVSGQVRGLLCDPCNRGIGLLKDSIAIVSSALVYLTKAR
jgi:hypothetical protein